MMQPARVEAGVSFDTDGTDEAPLLCDVYHPEPDQANGAATILLHGGGWRFGDRAMMADAAAELSRHGFLAVALEYRLLGQAAWPAPLDDTKSAIRWLRAEAGRFGIHPERITLTGFSAGAHLALLAAGTPDRGAPVDSPYWEQPERVGAVAAFFPPTRIGAGQARMLGIAPEEAAAVSPIEQVGAGFPPTLLLHGTGDTMVPHTASLEMFDALVAVGASADLRLYARLPHEFQQLPGLLAPTLADVAAFFDRHVVSRAGFDAAHAALQRRWDERAQAARPAAAR
jgi:acetyl esterase/lipase